MYLLSYYNCIQCTYDDYQFFSFRLKHIKLYLCLIDNKADSLADICVYANQQLLLLLLC